MKKLQYTLPVLLFLLSTSLFSQHRRVNKDRMRNYKIAHITEKLNLTEKEAQLFWPIYNSHESSLDKFRKEESANLKKLFANNNSIDDISEADARKIMTSIEGIKNKIHSVNQEYYKKLKKVLSYKKILKLKVSERDFKRHLFEKMRKRRKIPKKEKN